MADNHHKYTGILLLIFALLILLGAIFFTISQTKVTSIAEYKAGNTKLVSAKNDLLIAYILGYIAAGMAIVLAILYFGHVAWGIRSEIPHLILFILLFLLVIVSGIFGILALSNIDNAKPANTNGSTGWIWAALIAGLLALVIVIISGAWRAQHNASSSAVVKTQQTLTFTQPSTTTYDDMTPPPYYAPSLPATTNADYITPSDLSDPSYVTSSM
jgi:hypothetical protein